MSKQISAITIFCWDMGYLWFLNNPNWKVNVCVILWRLKRTPTKAFSVRRTFLLTVFAKTESWFIEGCLHFCNNMNYHFVVLNQTNMWRVNLKQSCQCGVHVFNCLLYISVYLFPVFYFSCAHSVFRRRVSSFENDKRARFLHCLRTPGWNQRWRRQQWPQFNSVN